MGWPFGLPFFSVVLFGWLCWLVITKKTKNSRRRSNWVFYTVTPSPPQKNLETSIMYGVSTISRLV